MSSPRAGPLLLVLAALAGLHSAAGGAQLAVQPPCMILPVPRRRRTSAPAQLPLAAVCVDANAAAPACHPPCSQCAVLVHVPVPAGGCQLHLPIHCRPRRAGACGDAAVHPANGEGAQAARPCVLLLLEPCSGRARGWVLETHPFRFPPLQHDDAVDAGAAAALLAVTRSLRHPNGCPITATMFAYSQGSSELGAGRAVACPGAAAQQAPAGAAGNSAAPPRLLPSVIGALLPRPLQTARRSRSCIARGLRWRRMAPPTRRCAAGGGLLFSPGPAGLHVQLHREGWPRPEHRCTPPCAAAGGPERGGAGC